MSSFLTCSGIYCHLVPSEAFMIINGSILNIKKKKKHGLCMVETQRYQ